EPPTLGLEGRCSIRLSYGRVSLRKAACGRGERIRTSDYLLPKQVGYTAAPPPAMTTGIDLDGPPLASPKSSRRRGRIARIARARCDRSFFGPTPASAEVEPSSGAEDSRA